MQEKKTHLVLIDQTTLKLLLATPDLLNKVGWEHKGRVKKNMENKIMRYLKIKMDRTEAKEKARGLVSLMEKNKDA